MTQSNDDIMFCVVRNSEDQYSLWPIGKRMPSGWSDTGVHGTRDACLQHVADNWGDMRPKSLRQRMAAEGETTRGGL